jgi:hypothetical protein
MRRHNCIRRFVAVSVDMGGHSGSIDYADVLAGLSPVLHGGAHDVGHLPHIPN